MAINFLQAQKRQKYMLLLLALIVLVILLIIWWGFFREEESLPATVSPLPVTLSVKIDWSTLKDAKLEGLKLFEEIAPFENEVGRSNPFVPY